MVVLTRAICAPRCTPFPLFPRSFPQSKCSSTALVAISPPMTDLVVACATTTLTTTKEVEDPTVDSTRSPGIRILRWWVMGSLHIQFLGRVRITSSDGEVGLLNTGGGVKAHSLLT
ncbi:uncharacterized protein [Glycine max]|uniref:uncharacterized protein n=1 Tax=Glycine max TaxID=3847 RepID=UPI001B355CF1|nr:uncharacterized protein LOC121172930 [Glycine max]